MPYPYYQNYPGYNQMYLQQLNNMQQPQQQATAQIQNGGLVIVKDIHEAMNYPVAPGNSVTFKDENRPYIYTKTLGFSQLDQPMFEVFKLVKEEGCVAESVSEAPSIDYLPLEEAELMKVQLNELKAEIDFLKEYIESEPKEEKVDA